MNEHKTDKKANARYWDKIDTIIENAVYEIADLSDVSLERKLDDIGGDGIVSDVRELVIGYLKDKGGIFPYVDENM